MSRLPRPVSIFMFLIQLDLFMPFGGIEQPPLPKLSPGLLWPHSPVSSCSCMSSTLVFVTNNFFSIWSLNIYCTHISSLASCHSLSLHTPWVTHNFNYYLRLSNTYKAPATPPAPTCPGAHSSQSSHLIQFHSCSPKPRICQPPTATWHGVVLMSVSPRVGLPGLNPSHFLSNSGQSG